MIRLRIVAPLLAAALLLTGCAEQGGQAPDGNGTQPWQQWQRPTTAPVAFSGPIAGGGTFDSSRYLGRVVVVNFWYAQCAPCVAEAPTLKALSSQFAADGVQFVGVNTRDGAADTVGFEKAQGLTYPSILDQQQSAAAQLEFATTVGPRDTPSTIVLDRKGRVTARVLGLADKGILAQFITDAVNGAAA